LGILRVLHYKEQEFEQQLSELSRDDALMGAGGLLDASERWAAPAPASTGWGHGTASCALRRIYG
jgi:hypothetical protein